MIAPMSEAELLAKLRAKADGPNGFLFRKLNEAEAIALLTSWRDEAVRAAYARGYAEGVRHTKMGPT